MKPLTENDIRESFVNALPGDLDRLPIPGLHEMLWEDREFLGWRDPQAHHRGYIVHWMDGRPVGLVVRSSSSSLAPDTARQPGSHTRPGTTRPGTARPGIPAHLRGLLTRRG